MATYKLTYSTLDTKVSIFRQGQLAVIERNGKQVAQFELADLWDFVHYSLVVLQPTDVGLSRRVYEARNLYKLTNEFVASLITTEENQNETQHIH